MFSLEIKKFNSFLNHVDLYFYQENIKMNNVNLNECKISTKVIVHLL